MKKLSDHHIELTIYWQDTEGLTYQAAADRLVKRFGKDAEVSSQALGQRVRRLREIHAEGGALKGAVPNLREMTDEQMLVAAREMAYERVYAANHEGNDDDLRKNIDTLLKIIGTKQRVAPAKEDDKDKEAPLSIRDMVRGDYGTSN